jgi:hypothetical protein
MSTTNKHTIKIGEGVDELCRNYVQWTDACENDDAFTLRVGTAKAKNIKTELDIITQIASNASMNAHPMMLKNIIFSSSFFLTKTFMTLFQTFLALTDHACVDTVAFTDLSFGDSSEALDISRVLAPFKATKTLFMKFDQYTQNVEDFDDNIALVTSIPSSLTCAAFINYPARPSLLINRLCEMKELKELWLDATLGAVLIGRSRKQVAHHDSKRRRGMSSLSIRRPISSFSLSKLVIVGDIMQERKESDVALLDFIRASIERTPEKSFEHSSEKSSEKPIVTELVLIGSHVGDALANQIYDIVSAVSLNDQPFENIAITNTTTVSPQTLDRLQIYFTNVMRWRLYCVLATIEERMKKHETGDKGIGLLSLNTVHTRPLFTKKIIKWKESVAGKILSFLVPANRVPDFTLKCVPQAITLRRQDIAREQQHNERDETDDETEESEYSDHSEHSSDTDDDYV